VSSPWSTLYFIELEIDALAWHSDLAIRPGDPTKVMLRKTFVISKKVIIKK